MYKVPAREETYCHTLRIYSLAHMQSTFKIVYTLWYYTEPLHTKQQGEGPGTISIGGIIPRDGFRPLFLQWEDSSAGPTDFVFTTTTNLFIQTLATAHSIFLHLQCVEYGKPCSPSLACSDPSISGACSVQMGVCV